MAKFRLLQGQIVMNAKTTDQIMKILASNMNCLEQRMLIFTWLNNDGEAFEITGKELAVCISTSYRNAGKTKAKLLKAGLIDVEILKDSAGSPAGYKITPLVGEL